MVQYILIFLKNIRCFFQHIILPLEIVGFFELDFLNFCSTFFQKIILPLEIVGLF